MPDRTYIAIDLKSFYASVECMDRNLDPMTTNLVVADESRTEKTICLAVSPSLKAHGIPGRARLFEVIQRVRAVNAERRHRAPGRQFSGKSANAPELQANPALELCGCRSPDGTVYGSQRKNLFSLPQICVSRTVKSVRRWSI